MISILGVIEVTPVTTEEDYQKFLRFSMYKEPEIVRPLKVNPD